MQILFWILIAIVVFTYVGYPISLFVMQELGLGRGQQSEDSAPLPTVAFVIAAYNEASCIREKIGNCLKLDYPEDLVSWVVVSDGSTDETLNIIGEYPEVKHYHQPERRGKVAAINRVMPLLNAEVVVLSDANTTLNEEALLEIGLAYQDDRVGAVSGEKVVLSHEVDDATAGEGMYWKYESAIKSMDSDLNTMVGCAGELMSFRRALYQPVKEDTYIEDFVLSMQIAAAGYRVKYCPKAKAYELPSASIGDEMKRKVRIAAGGLQAIWRLRPILNPLRYGMLTYQYIGHRVLRWTLAPLSLPLLLILNLLLSIESDFYLMVFLMQVVFYGTAILGGYLKSRKFKAKGLFIPYYFVMMNYAVFQGLARIIRGTQKVTWDKAERRLAVATYLNNN